jgi:hypothetical protein
MSCEIPDHIINILNERFDHVNVIDVGASYGPLISNSKPKLKVPSFWVGIDPLEYTDLVKYDGRRLYDVFFVGVIDDVSEATTSAFNQYKDGGYSSLLKVDPDLITNDKTEINKWFFPIEQDGAYTEGRTSLVGVIDVKVLPLFILIEELKMTKETIHYLKVDAQGKDHDVVKSLGGCVSNVLYIQLECNITPDDAPVLLYKDQIRRFDDDIRYMESIGFVVDNFQDHGEENPNEADVVFINTDLFDGLSGRPS